MSDTIVIALISLAGTLTGSFCGVLASNKLTNYRIEQLERKMDKHNGLVEITYNLREKATLVDEQMKVANHRIEDLEDEVKRVRS